MALSSKSPARLLLLGSLALVGCGKEPRGGALPAPVGFNLVETPEVLSKSQWIAKVGRILRDGKVLTSDEIEGWQNTPKSEIIEKLMEDTRFIDAVARFNLFYLGFESDLLDLKGPAISGIFPALADYPSAINAAHEVARDGNYLRLYDLIQPRYVMPLSGPLFVSDDEKNLSRKEIRAEYFRGMERSIQKMLEAYESRQAPADFCEVFQIEAFALNTGLSTKVGIGFQVGQELIFGANWFGPLASVCGLPGGSKLPDVPKVLAEIKAGMVDVERYLDELDPEAYRLGSIADIQILDTERLAIDLPGKMLTRTGFWVNLTNSSTNFNRKRAAYALKRFFCDDLTPVGVVVPENHGSDLHASEPSCQACHYKLDPMAGFFRDRGIIGVDFSESPTIFLDDAVVLDREEYVSQWKEKDGSPRPWNVGYIRSLSDPSLNDYGDTLDNPGVEDLFEIIKRAPEARRCLVKNMFQYFVGRDLTPDPGYLDHLAKVFGEKSRDNSALAFKDTLQSLVTSTVFSLQNPQSDRCYDFEPGSDSRGGPPCQVSFLLSKNCASCHSRSGASGGLDLTSWISTDPIGEEMGFPHMVDGKQVAAVRTMELIAERLASDDLKLRMPLDRHIDAVERDEIYLWTQDVIHKTQEK